MPRRWMLLVLSLLLAGPALGQNPSFTLVNNTARVIIELYASPVTETAWGQDRIAGNPLPPGGSRAIRMAGDGNCLMDIRVVFQGGGDEERRGVDTCRMPQVAWGATTAPPVATAPPPAAPVTPARPSGPPAQPSAPAPPPTAGGKSAPGAPAARREGNPSFNLVNRSGRTIEQFYASPASRSDWGPDRLGRDVVPAGRRYAIRLPLGECLYDLRVVYQGGSSEERRGVDTCDLTDVSFP